MTISLDVGFEGGALLLGLVCMLYIFTEYREKKSIQRLFYLLLLGNVMVTAVTDMIRRTLEQQANPALNGLIAALTAVYYLLHVQIAPLYCCYVLNVTSTGLRCFRKRFDRVLLLVPCMITILLVLLNIPFGFLYTVSGGVYTRGNPAVLMIAALWYMFISCRDIIRNRQSLSRRTIFGLVDVLICSAAGFVLQILVPFLVIELFAMAFGLLLTMLLIECDDRLFEQGTKIRNRHAFRQRAKEIMAQKISCTFLSLRFSEMNFNLSLLTAKEKLALRRQISAWLTKDFAMWDVLFFEYTHDRYVFFILNDEEGSKKRMLIERIRERFRDTWAVGNYQIQLNAIVLPLQIPEDCSSLKGLISLLEFEDSRPQDTVTVLGTEAFEDMKSRLAIESCIRRILKNDGIQVYFQPIWDAKTDSIIAAEALMRVTDQELGYVRPDLLVATAERCGLIGAVDLQVLEKVCRFIHDYRPQDHGLKYVEINISVGEMLGANLARDYTDMLNRYGVPVEMINIEFLETLSNDDSEVFQQAKKSLQDAGFAFSLDDFGTEFSNMGRLFNNNFTNIKIDKSLLWDADKDPNSKELLASLTEMIEKMRFVPLQEGVETKEQLTFVTQHGCRLIQGYYFSKALPAPEFMDYLVSFRGVQTAG